MRANLAKAIGLNSIRNLVEYLAELKDNGQWKLSPWWLYALYCPFYEDLKCKKCGQAFPKNTEEETEECECGAKRRTTSREHLTSILTNLEGASQDLLSRDPQRLLMPFIRMYISEHAQWNKHVNQALLYICCYELNANQLRQAIETQISMFTDEARYVIAELFRQIAGSREDPNDRKELEEWIDKNILKKSNENTISRRQ